MADEARAARTELMDEDPAKIARAIGRTLREVYTTVLKVPPAEMTELVERLEQLPRSEVADPAQKSLNRSGVSPG